MIVISGSTGTVGRALVAELSARGVALRLLVRPGARSAAQVDRHGEVVEVDITESGQVRRALTGARRLFLLTPFGPRQDVVQVAMIAEAVRAGVEAVVKLSALGAAPDAAASVHRQHGNSDECLRRSGLRYAVLRPNAFMQNASQWLPTIDGLDAVALPTGRARVSMIDVRDIAEVAAVLLTAEDLTDGSHDLTGPQALSYADVARTLSTAAGRTIRHWDLSPAEAAGLMRRAGIADWAISARLELYESYRRGEADLVTDTVHSWTGRPARSFAAYATEVADRLRRPVALRAVP
ncbi:NAD(P)H-binding protein [Micromonospora sp. LOL_023]|uniref:NAD(P)H-binding protein n=1 Tax=Micromonospora sp. LOL_023 TaxID=3345418 RepID=UPI003A8571CE